MKIPKLVRGATWNESRTFLDPLTGRKVRQITTAGAFNQAPTYHTDTCFTADGDRFIFVTQRDGLAALCCAETETGQIAVVADPVPAETGFDGMAIALAAEARRAVYRIGETLQVVDLDGGAVCRVLDKSESGARITLPNLTSDGRLVAFTRIPVAPPELKSFPEQYAWWTQHGGAWMELVVIDLQTGSENTLYREEGVLCAHTQVNPGNPDLFLLDRDYPPLFAWGSDGQRTRTNLFRRSTRTIQPLNSAVGTPFQVHSTFSHDGTTVIYHGWLGRTNHAGWYFSVFDAHGERQREFAFPEAGHYGHVSAAADRPAMILDGNLASDRFQYLYYDRDQPRFEVIGHHGTEWDSLPGQGPHPHPHNSRDGRWLAWTAAKAGRTDVFVMNLS